MFIHWHDKEERHSITTRGRGSIPPLKQGEHMTNHEYLEKFQDIIKHVEHHGGEPGCQDSRVSPIIQ